MSQSAMVTFKTKKVYLVFAICSDVLRCSIERRRRQGQESGTLWGSSVLSCVELEKGIVHKRRSERIHRWKSVDIAAEQRRAKS